MTRRTLPQPGSIGLTAYEQRLADDLKRALDRVSDLETALHIADAMREKHLANLRACMEKRDAAEARIAELEAVLLDLIAWAASSPVNAVTMSAWIHGVKFKPEDVAVWDEARAKLAARAATTSTPGDGSAET